jgi:hypothetical protein
LADVESNQFYSKPNEKSQPNHKSLADVLPNEKFEPNVDSEAHIHTYTLADVLPNEKFEPNVDSEAHIHTYKRKSNGKFQALNVHGQHPRLG